MDYGISVVAGRGIRHNKTLGVQQQGGLTPEIVVPVEKIILNDTLAPQHLALVEP
ncbi:hypothetical protein [Paracoccus denitrificans]|uniref:hypothetical protein n=1 Tax=Paracoccus denitrificans TaxID=266 RepID=UPI00336511D7